MAFTPYSSRASIVSSGTPVSLGANFNSSVCQQIMISASSSNTGAVYIGDASVSAQSGSEKGVRLTPGASLPPISAARLTSLYFDGVATGETITWLAMV